MVAACAEGICQLQVALAGTVPRAQAAGDCQELICDGRGATIPRENLGDTPADDQNPCTDEVCGASGPEHASVAAGATCGEAGVCNGKGRCGACVPDVKRCENNAAQACSDEGDWSPAVACAAGTPVCAQGSCARIATLALGDAHRCVTLDRDRDGGAACAWSTTSPQTIGKPAPVPGLSGATAIAVGPRHRCALVADGTARCWGNNAAGELGDGTREGRPTPAPVLGVEGAVQIAAGAGHTCARLQSGAVICWGRDDQGQLGDTATPTPTPNPTAHAMLKVLTVERGIVSELLPNEITALALGGDATCGLRRGGSVACWGALKIDAAPAGPGKGAPLPAPKPKPVAGLKGVTSIALGGDHSCAILQDGTATCWGDNAAGQLGDGSAAKKHGPAKVKGLKDVSALALGRDHTCALLRDATVACWGSNTAGQLGDGSTTDRRVPAPVPGLAGVTAIVAAGQRTCAIGPGGAALCWGDDADGAIHGAKPTPTALSW